VPRKAERNARNGVTPSPPSMATGSSLGRSGAFDDADGVVEQVADHESSHRSSARRALLHERPAVLRGRR